MGGEVAITGFVGRAGARIAGLAGESSFSGALGGVFPANGSSSAHKHERPLHVHRRSDELQMAALRASPR
jgi:hypothetical protein